MGHAEEHAGSGSSAAGLDQETALRVVLGQEPLLTGFLRAIVGSRPVAEDLFQDLVVLVLRKHAEIPNAEAVPGWTRRAARFLALKALEKRARERPTMDETLIDLLERTFVEEVPASADPYLAALTHCRARLPEHARELLTLRYVHDLSGEQLAARLGRPLNTVWVTLTRLHRLLRECIQAQLRRGDD